MAISTTTLAAVINSLTETITDTVPAMLARHGFVRCERKHDLRTWAEAGGGEGILRKFQVTRLDGRTDPGIVEDVSYMTQDLEILVAYPSLPGLYGDEQIEDFEDVIASDQHQIWSEVYSSENYIDGVGLQQPRLDSVERGDGVWFARLLVTVQWYQDSAIAVPVIPAPDEAPLELGASLWLRSDLGITSAGGTVSAWLDQSGNGRHTAQASAPAQPALTAAALNNHAIVQFGAAQYLGFSPVWAQTPVFVLYAVVVYTRTASYQLLLQGQDSTPNTHAYLGSTGADQYKPYAYAASGSATWSAQLANATAYIIRFKFNYTLNTVAVSVNGGTEVEGNAATNIVEGNWAAVGSNLGIQDCYSGIAELVGFSSVLAAPDNATLMDYFTTRYDL